MPEAQKPKILYVEDEDKYRARFQKLFGKDYEITYANTYDEAVSLGGGSYDLVVLDGNLDNGHTGPEFHKLYLNNQNAAPVVYMTSKRESWIKEELTKYGIPDAKFNYMSKGDYHPHIWPDEMARYMSAALEKKGIEPDGV